MRTTRPLRRTRWLAAITAGALVLTGAPAAWADPELGPELPQAAPSAASSATPTTPTPTATAAPSTTTTTSSTTTKTAPTSTTTRTSSSTAAKPTATTPTATTPTATTPTTPTTKPGEADETAAAKEPGAAAESTVPEVKKQAANQAEALTATNLGALSVNSGGPWGSIVPNTNGNSASGILPVPSVATSVRQSWVATITSSDFVNGSHVIPCSAVTYRASGVTRGIVSGSATSTGAQTGLCSPKDVVIRDDAWALDITTWTANLTVDFPNGASIGTYTGTITVSVY